MKGAKICRANLPARVWIEWRIYPVRPWVVMSDRGAVIRAFSPEGCERWLARYGYAIRRVNEEGFTGDAYVRATADTPSEPVAPPPGPRNAV